MNKKLSIIYITIAVLLVLASKSVFASSNFVQLELPKNIFIELPKNWVVLSNNQRITLDSVVESGLDLSRIEQQDSMLPFAANYYDDNGKTAAIINIRYYPESDLSQRDARQISDSDVDEIDIAWKKNLIKGVEVFGITVKSWKGTKKVKINRIVAFQTEYRRNSIKSNSVFRVRLIRVFANNRSFTLTISYRESDELFLGKITDRIIASLQM